MVAGGSIVATAGMLVLVAGGVTAVVGGCCSGTSGGATCVGVVTGGSVLTSSVLGTSTGPPFVCIADHMRIATTADTTHAAAPMSHHAADRERLRRGAMRRSWW